MQSSENVPLISQRFLSGSSYCYGSHPLLWHPLGLISSECVVQQGDPLGLLLLSLALQKYVSSIDADDDCINLLLQAWYMDDGVLAGNCLAVQLVEELGPVLGIHINFSKYELFSRMGNTSFPPLVKCSFLPEFSADQLEITGTALIS